MRMQRLLSRSAPFAAAAGVGWLTVREYMTAEPKKESVKHTALSLALQPKPEQRTPRSSTSAVPADPLPPHLTLGARVLHSRHGEGTVVKVQRGAPALVYVSFDEDGLTHSYDEADWVRLVAVSTESRLRTRTTEAEQAADAADRATMSAQPHMRERRVPQWVHVHHVDALATCLSSIIDLDSIFTPAVQLYMFRSAVVAVCHRMEELLPPPFLALCHGHGMREGIQPAEAEDLVERLTGTLHEQRHSAVDLPFLPTAQEWQVVAFVVAMLVGSMSKGVNLDDMLQARSPPTAHPVPSPALPLAPAYPHPIPRPSRLPKSRFSPHPLPSPACTARCSSSARGRWSWKSSSKATRAPLSLSAAHWSSSWWASWTRCRCSPPR